MGCAAPEIRAPSWKPRWPFPRHEASPQHSRSQLSNYCYVPLLLLLARIPSSPVLLLLLLLLRVGISLLTLASDLTDPTPIKGPGEPYIPRGRSRKGHLHMGVGLHVEYRSGVDGDPNALVLCLGRQVQAAVVHSRLPLEFVPHLPLRSHPPHGPPVPPFSLLSFLWAPPPPSLSLSPPQSHLRWSGAGKPINPIVLSMSKLRRPLDHFLPLLVDAS